MNFTAVRTAITFASLLPDSRIEMKFSSQFRKMQIDANVWMIALLSFIILAHMHTEISIFISTDVDRAHEKLEVVHQSSLVEWKQRRMSSDRVDSRDSAASLLYLNLSLLLSLF